MAVIPYHGLPITPMTAAVEVAKTGHVFVSKRHADQLGVAIEVAQSFAIDNGAFPAWKSGVPITDWGPFYEWASECRRVPNCDFAVIPDVIDGDEKENDRLIEECPLPSWFAAPVWHMHESLDRLVRLSNDFPRICLGSSGDFSKVGTPVWWGRMRLAMAALCDERGRPRCKLHGLRMLNGKVASKLPLSSADSTNVARNIGLDKKWTGSYPPLTKESRASLLRHRIEASPSTATWDYST